MTHASSLVGEEKEAFTGLTGEDRRRFPRLAPPPAASLRLQHGVPTRLLDLGLGGALIEASTRLVPGTVTGIKMTTGDVAFRARAHIRRASVTGTVRAERGEGALIYRAGLEFDRLSPAEVDLLKTALAPAERGAGGMYSESRPAAPAAERTITTVSPSPLVSFRFPPGWVVTRNESGAAAREPNSRGFAFVRALPPGQRSDLCELARVSMHEAGFSTIHCRQAEINGLDACVGFYHGWLDALGEVLAEAAHIAVHDRTYLIAGVAAWTAYDALRHAFFATIRSFVGEPPAAASVCLNREECPPASESDEDGAGPNRRQHLRVAGPFDGYRIDLLETPVRIYDLAAGGCFINSLHDTTENGQRFGLKILLPVEGWITVEAETLYSRPGFGFAVRFVELPEHTRGRLDRALRKLQTRRERLGH